MEAQGSVIRHLGIIVDGNRRYARGKGQLPWKGHEEGAKKLELMLNVLAKLGVKELTLYVFSTENFGRDKLEVEMLMKLFGTYFDRLLKDPRLEKDKIRINFIGNLSLFEKSLQEKARKLMKKTEDYDNLVINFAFGYGGRKEITHAVREICEKVKRGEIEPSEVTEETVAEHLYLRDDPDAIIRTGGAMRTSNFLPWQSVYSEWFFLKKFWPDIEEADIVQVMKEFSERKRNFGK
jgi:undecaprenyl diphosphate synthase